MRQSGCVRALAGVMVAMAMTAAAAPSALAAPTPDQAIAELNTWRAELGESPVSTTSVAAWNTGCQHHDNYEHLNGNGLTHNEVSGNPGYTTDGAQAGTDSVLAASWNALSDDELLPGPVWDSGVFHRAAVLEPRLAQVGFDATTFADGTSLTCLWVLNQDANPPQAIDNTRTTPGLTLYPSPGNGAYDVPTRFPAGTESPDPAQETGVPAGATLGWLLNVEINGPWASSGFGYYVYAHDVTATLAPDGGGPSVPVVVSECGSSGCGGAGSTADGPYFHGGFGIFPTQPLAANTTYRVVLTGGTVTDGQAHVDYPIPPGYSWCFSTGATYTPTADCAAATTAAQEPITPDASTVTNPSPAPSPASGTGPGSGTGATSGTSGTAPSSGPGSGAGTQQPKPITKSASVGGSLRGVRSGRPVLTLDLSSSVRISTLRLGLGAGLSFTTRMRSLRNGVSVTVRGRRQKLVLARVHGSLSIRLRTPATAIQVRVGPPALHATRALAGKHPRRVTITFRTNGGGASGRLTLTPG